MIINQRFDGVDQKYLFETQTITLDNILANLEEIVKSQKQSIMNPTSETETVAKYEFYNFSSVK